jgi:hypothetical protein
MFNIKKTSGLDHQVGVPWCMLSPRKKPTKEKPMKIPSALRASITFPPEIYRNLEEIAKQKKVSIAWVVRDAAEKYIADQWPLFHKTS